MQYDLALIDIIDLAFNKGYEPEFEDELQRIVVAFIKRYIKPSFPDLVLIVNPFASNAMGAKAMNEAKALGFESSQPDIIILQKSAQYVGIALELKRQHIATKIIKKDGAPYNEHIKKQLECINKMKKQGYYAKFSVGLANTITTILLYFYNPENL